MSFNKFKIKRKKLFTLVLGLIIHLISVSEIQSTSCMSSDMKLVEFGSNSVTSYGQATLSPLTIVTTNKSSGAPGAIVYNEKLFIDTDFQINLKISTTKNPISFDGFGIVLSTNKTSIYRPNASGGSMGYIGFTDGIVLEVDPYYNSDEKTSSKSTHAVFRKCMGTTICNSYIHNKVATEQIYYFNKTYNYTTTQAYSLELNVVYDHTNKNLKLYLGSSITTAVLTYSADMPTLFSNYAYFGFVGVMKSCDLYDSSKTCSTVHKLSIDYGHVCLQYVNSTFKLKYNGALYDNVTITAGSTIAVNIDYKDYIFANPPIGTLSSEGNKCGFDNSSITYNTEKSVITENIITCTVIPGTYKINLSYGSFNLNLAFTVIPGPLYALIFITPEGNALSPTSSTVTLSSNLLMHGKYNTADTDNESSTILVFRAVDKYNNLLIDLGTSSDVIKNNFGITIKYGTSSNVNCIYSNLGDGTYKLILQTNNVGKYTLSSNYLINQTSGSKITYSFERATMNMFENYQELDYYQELEGYLENEGILVQEELTFKEKEEYQILVDKNYNEQCQEEITEYIGIEVPENYQERLEEELIKEVTREREESYKKLEREECKEYYEERKQEEIKAIMKFIEKFKEEEEYKENKEIKEEVVGHVEEREEYEILRNELVIEKLKEELEENYIEYVREHYLEKKVENLIEKLIVMNEEKYYVEMREKIYVQEKICQYNTSLFESLNASNERRNLFEYTVEESFLTKKNYDDIICYSLINEIEKNSDTNISLEDSKTYFHFYDNKNKSNAIDHNALSKCERDLKAAYNISKKSKLFFAELVLNDSFLLSKKNIKFKVFDEKGEELNISVCEGSGIILSFNLTDLNSNDINYTELLINSEKNINILNALENIFNDECSSYSQDKFDLTIKDRRDYIFKNLSLCSDGCELSSINDSQVTCICNNLSKIKEFWGDDVPPKKLSYNVFTNTKVKKNNLSLFLCYRRFGELNVIVFYVGIFLMLSSILSMIIYLAKELKYTVLFFKMFSVERPSNLNEKISNNFNTTGMNQNKDKTNIQDIRKYIKEVVQNPVRKRRKNERTSRDGSPYPYAAKNSEKGSYKTSKFNIFDKIELSQNSSSTYRHFQYTKIEEMKMVNYYKNLSWNLNNLKYEDAIILDKEKNCCKYLLRILKSKIILFSFLCNEYTFYLPISLRLLIVLYNISLYIFLQCIHYGPSYISKLYTQNINERKNIFLYLIYNDLYRCIIVSIGAIIIGRLINMLLVPRIIINKLLISRTNKNKSNYNYKKLFYFTNTIMILLIFLILSGSWYYSSIFSAVYKYTQIYMLFSCFISMFISLIIVLIICLLFGTLKFKGLINKNS